MHARKVYTIGVVLLLSTILFPTMTQHVQAMEITVGSGTGYDFSTIQEAINASDDADTIIIQAGRYDPFSVEGIADLSIITNGSVIIENTDTIALTTDEGIFNATAVISNATDFFMENMTFDGDETTQNRTVGLWIYNSTAIIHNCTTQDFSGTDLDEDDQNASQHACYGMAIMNTTITVTNLTSVNNQIGFILMNASVTLENTTMSGKQTGITAGVFVNALSNFTANNSVFTSFANGNRSAGMYTEQTTANLNVTVTNCTVHDNVIGFALMNGTVIEIHNCSFYDNDYGILGNTSIDARYNWWGSVNGPNCTSNTYNENQQGDSFQYGDTNTYVPWLNASYETGSPIAPIINDDTAYFIELENALDNATDGTTVAIRAGTFNQSADIVLNNISDLFINGTEAFGSHYSNISLTFSNVTNLELRNLSLSNVSGDCISFTDFNNIFISHLQFTNSTSGIRYIAQGTVNTLANSQIEHCIFDECTNGILLAEATSNDAEIKDITIHNNTFKGNTYGINTSNAATDSSYINASNLTIKNNTFYNSVNKAIRNWQSEQVDATYNYWFNHKWSTDFISAGPAGEGLGNGDPIAGNISFSPFYSGHVTVREDSAHNITINNGLDDADITSYSFDWNNNGTFENTTNNPYIIHTFSDPGNQTVQLQITGSGPYSGLFQAIVEDDVTYNLKKKITGYNIIGIIEKEISCAELINKSENITRICYWNESEQNWSPSYIAGWSEPSDPENHIFVAGDEALLFIQSNDTIHLYGYYPTMETEEITIYNGSNWLARTGPATTAKKVGENLTADGVDWSTMMKWREGLQRYDDPYLPSSSDAQSFTINPGDELMIIKNATTTKLFSMEGW